MLITENVWLFIHYGSHSGTAVLCYGPQHVTLRFTHAFLTSLVRDNKITSALSITPAIFTTVQTIDINVKIASNMQHDSSMAPREWQLLLFLTRLDVRHVVWTVTCVTVPRVPTVLLANKGVSWHGMGNLTTGQPWEVGLPRNFHVKIGHVS